MAELLACEYRRYVYLHNGCDDGRDGVAQRDRGVGVSARIQDDAVITAYTVVDGIDEFALDVRLVVVELDAAFVTVSQLRHVVVEGGGAVGAYVARTLKVEVRAVEYEYLFHCHSYIFAMVWFCSTRSALCASACSSFSPGKISIGAMKRQ